jgi:predicted DNA-binding protein (MmcQ/YjbR family)
MLDFDTLRAYCLAKPGATESLPFDNETLVFKVCDKMFAVLPLEADPLQMVLKGDPEQIPELQAQYVGIYPPRYFSKKHWTALEPSNDLPHALVLQLIDQSYTLVVRGLPKRLQATLETQPEA